MLYFKSLFLNIKLRIEISHAVTIHYIAGISKVETHPSSKVTDTHQVKNTLSDDNSNDTDFSEDSDSDTEDETHETISFGP